MSNKNHDNELKGGYFGKSLVNYTTKKATNAANQVYSAAKNVGNYLNDSLNYLRSTMKNDDRNKISNFANLLLEQYFYTVNIDKTSGLSDQKIKDYNSQSLVYSINEIGNIIKNIPQYNNNNDYLNNKNIFLSKYVYLTEIFPTLNRCLQQISYIINKLFTVSDVKVINDAIIGLKNSFEVFSNSLTEISTQIGNNPNYQPPEEETTDDKGNIIKADETIIDKDNGNILRVNIFTGNTYVSGSATKPVSTISTITSYIPFLGKKPQNQEENQKKNNIISNDNQASINYGTGGKPRHHSYRKRINKRNRHKQSRRHR